jgi:hypothetical protein
VPGGQRVAAPHVVDQYVQPALLAVDALHEGLDLLRNQMVDGHRDAGAAGRRDELGGLLDGLGAVHLGPLGARAASGGVDRGAGRTELHRDLPPGASRRPGHESDLSGQWLLRHTADAVHKT